MILGIVGGGQLGKMLAESATSLGVSPRVLDPSPDCCARGSAEHTLADFADSCAIAKFAKDCDVVTYEFENVPSTSLKSLEDSGKLRPPVLALRTSQDRWLEKQCFSKLEIPAAPSVRADSTTPLSEIFSQVGGLPCVVKTRTLGYDGKGQRVVRTESELKDALRELGGNEQEPAKLIIEALINFRRECSVIGVRSLDGEIRTYPLVENHHRDGVLRVSVVDENLFSSEIVQEAQRLCVRLMEDLEYVGTLALELFETKKGLLANEFAPRVHNSGHFSIEGSACSQFENHVRAVCGIPLGEPASLGPSVMINLLGEIVDVQRMEALPNAFLHDYGKSPRPGRKLGHLTLTDTRLKNVPGWLLPNAF